MLKKINFGKKKPSEQGVAEPRSKEEINKDYSGLVSKAGELQFQTYALKSQIASINSRIVTLGEEMNRREELDAATAAKESENGSNTPPRAT